MPQTRFHKLCKFSRLNLMRSHKLSSNIRLCWFTGSMFRPACHKIGIVIHEDIYTGIKIQRLLCRACISLIISLEPWTTVTLAAIFRIPWIKRDKFYPNRRWNKEWRVLWYSSEMSRKQFQEKAEVFFFKKKISSICKTRWRGTFRGLRFRHHQDLNQW